MAVSAQVTSPAVVRRHAVFHDLRVAEIQPLTDDAVTITFELPEELREAYEFVQGQHLSLRCTVAGDDVRRNYSICSPAGSGVLRVAVKRLRDGVFSSHAHSVLRPGDTIEVLTPTGRFNVPLDPASARSYVAIAAGSGITPILSILATTLEVEPRSQFTLLFGNRGTQSIMFLEELEDLKNRFPSRLRTYHVLSREPQEIELFNGRIDDAKLRTFLASLVPPDQVDEWFLCGPPLMIRALRSVLAGAGVDPHHVHAELFHAESLAPREEPSDQRREAAAGEAKVTVFLDGRSSVLSVPRSGETILNATLKVRPDAPYACKGGVCGTCRAKLVAGEVSMDQCYALEESEVDAGFVLACQSHPLTDSVTLDFDK